MKVKMTYKLRQFCLAQAEYWHCDTHQHQVAHIFILPTTTTMAKFWQLSHQRFLTGRPPIPASWGPEWVINCVSGWWANTVYKNADRHFDLWAIWSQLRLTNSNAIFR